MLRLNFLDKLIRSYFYFYYLCYFNIINCFIMQKDNNDTNFVLQKKYYNTYIHKHLDLSNFFKKFIIIICTYYYKFK